MARPRTRNYGGARTVVVIGPPAAGKSTHVRESAAPDDVVIDLDELARALSVGAPDHDYPNHIVHVAIGARAAAIERATRLREPVTVWLIHATPSPLQLAAYRASRFDVVTIDPGPEVVYARCAEIRPPEALAVADRWYAAHGIRA